MNKLLILFAFSLFMVKGYAQSDSTLNLEECIAYSLENHASVKISRNKEEIAFKERSQSIGLYLPQIQGVVTATDNLKIQTSVISTDIAGMDEAEVQLGKKHASNAYLDVNQVIYDQTKLLNIKTAKTQVEKAGYETVQNKEQLIYNTARAYFQVLIYGEYEEQLNDNLDNYRKLATIMKLKLDKGSAIETDYQRIVVSRQSTAYQLNEMETQRTNALNSLKYSMGYPMDKKLQVADSVNMEKYLDSPQNQNWSVDSLTEYSIDELNVHLQKMSYESSRASRLPKLNAVARFGSQSLGDNLSGSFNNWNDYSYVGLSLNIPLFSGFRNSSKVKEERFAYENARFSLNLSRQQYQLEYENSQQSLLSSWNSLKKNKDNMDLAHHVYENTQLAYQNGGVPLTDFLNDDNAYKNAQSNYLSSLYSYMIARLDFERSKGTLISFYNQMKNN